MAFGVPNIATAGVRMTPDFTGFGSSLKAGLAGNIGAAAKAAGIGLAGVGTAAIAAAGAAAAAFIPVETQFARIEGLVGVTGDQLEELKAALPGIATATGKGPQELAEALFFVTSAGLRGKDAIDALNVSAKASTAGLGETKVVADAVTSAMNAYGPANLNAAAATDVLVATVREGKAEADAIAQSIGRVVPLASQLGIGFDQVGASIAAMTRLGLDANESATALRGIMSTLIKPSSQARDVLEEVGLSFEDLRNKAGTEGLLPVLQLLQERLGGNEEALAAVFPNVRALSGVLNLMGSNAEATEGIFASLADSTGALDNAFGVASETAEVKLQKALAGIKTTLVDAGAAVAPLIASLGTQLAPVISKLIPPLVKLGEKFLRLFERLTPIIDAVLPLVDVILDLVDVLLDALEPVIDPLIELIEEFGYQIAANLTIALKLLTPVLKGIGEALGFIFNIGTKVLGFFGGIADKVRDFFGFGPALDELRNKGREVPDEITAAFGESRDQISQFASDVSTGVTDAFGATREPISQFAGSLTSLGTETMPDLVEDMVGGAEEIAEGVEDALIDPIQEVLNETVSLFEGAVDEIEISVEEIIANLDEQAEQHVRFTDAINELTALGLDALVRELLDAGPEATAAAEALAADPTAAFAANLKLAELTGVEIEALKGVTTALQQSVVDKFNELGLAGAEGYLRGLTANGLLSQWVADALIDETVRGMNQAKHGLGIFSPSRLFAEQVGEPLGEGVVAGLREGISTLGRAVTSEVGEIRLGNTTTSTGFGQPIGDRPIEITLKLDKKVIGEAAGDELGFGEQRLRERVT